MVRKLFLAGIALFAASFILTVVVDADQQAVRAQPARTQTAAADKGYAQKPAPALYALPPLPTVSFEPVEPLPVLRQVYEFAARHPEVLQYVPCYCGCENVGHKANHDCFVKSRAADGRVTQWDSHGMGCAVCLGVGRKAMAMFNQGMSVPAIRAAIEKEYGSHYPSHTPTPSPTAKG
jgi:hypothetical protein